MIFPKPIALLFDENFTKIKTRKKWHKVFSWRRKNSLNGRWRQLLYLDKYFHKKRFIKNRDFSKPVALRFDEDFTKIKTRKKWQKVLSWRRKNCLNGP